MGQVIHIGDPNEEKIAVLDLQTGETRTLLRSAIATVPEWASGEDSIRCLAGSFDSPVTCQPIHLLAFGRPCPGGSTKLFRRQADAGSKTARATPSGVWCGLSAAILGLSAWLVLPTSGVAQQIPLAEQPFNEFSLRARGQPVIPIFDGWYPNPDGTRSLCFGYKNLNLEEALDVPLGPDNLIEPAAFDGLQPTHFAPAPESLDRTDPKARYRRQYCVFIVRVPADFGERRIRWTVRAHGETISNPGHVLPTYVIDEPRSDGRGAVAPRLRIGNGGTTVQGRNGATVGPLRAKVGTPLPLEVSAEHPSGRTWLGWFHHQGAGAVTFSVSESTVEGTSGTATTTATFSRAGEYVLLIQAIDTVDDLEFMCCWTNVWVRVTVEES